MQQLAGSLAGKSRTARAEVIRLKVAILADKDFNKIDREVHACWESDTSTVYLRASRVGTERLEDWLHECKHVWVDKIDNDR